jgi:hypothetical protein
VAQIIMASRRNFEALSMVHGSGPVNHRAPPVVGWAPKLRSPFLSKHVCGAVYSTLDKSSRSEPNTPGGRVGVARRPIACRAIARAAGARRGARARVREGARESAQAHGA